MHPKPPIFPGRPRLVAMPASFTNRSPTRSVPWDSLHLKPPIFQEQTAIGCHTRGIHAWVAQHQVTIWPLRGLATSQFVTTVDQSRSRVRLPAPKVYTTLGAALYQCESSGSNKQTPQAQQQQQTPQTQQTNTASTTKTPQAQQTNTASTTKNTATHNKQTPQAQRNRTSTCLL